MQILKDSVRTAILSSAKKEFRQKGFKSASLRVIAKDAEITVGNLYRYFKNKEHLFETLVAPVLEALNNQIAWHEEMHEEFNDDYEEYKKHHNKMMEEMFWFIRNHKDELVIIMECSEGSVFETRKEIFTGWLRQHSYTELKRWYRDKDDEWIQLYALAISKSYFEGLMEIVKNSDNLDTVIDVLKSFSEAFQIGFEKNILEQRAQVKH